MNIYETLGIDLTDPHMCSALEMEESRRELIRKLTSIRKASHLTQDDVARELGVSRQSISKIEQENRNPTLSTLIGYAIAVGAHITFSVDTINSEDSHSNNIRIFRTSMDGNESSWGPDEIAWPQTSSHDQVFSFKTQIK
ncbi:helix-turn-helix domain-containing protein [Arcanobacterium phocae]|uniref:DNA-binding transcriptional regulator, XRE-family HTH domain n=1 Tax=Arcanobacterium phocae TaxID=131112 RepID=A0A1H2LBI0_9ACTO|nr:helix-turn-helix transcriptional regulator [Arcanobacterium phocae]SDU78192.1 DNA-binding transcriptional regulator, XRE-family HTH domain [Arcanobacterium phocae]